MFLKKFLELKVFADSIRLNGYIVLLPKVKGILKRSKIDNILFNIQENSNRIGEISFDLNETQHFIWIHEAEIELITSGLKVVENILKLIMPKNCPIEKSGYFYIMEKCYFFSSEKTKWDLAKVNCTNNFPDGRGKLFEPQNKEISDLVRKKQLNHFNSSEVRIKLILIVVFPNILLVIE